MKTLTGQDAFLLYAETPEQHQHTLGVMILDPSTSGGAFDIGKLRARLEAGIGAIPAYRQRLVDLPFGLVPPTLVDDPAFRVRNHIHHVGCPAPGDERALGELLSDFASVALDRRKPLWETWIIDGLEGGRVALATKSHHCISDGVQGAEFMGRMFDTGPDAPARRRTAPAPWDPARESLFGVARGAWRHRWNTETSLANVLARTVRSTRNRRRAVLAAGAAGKWTPPLLAVAPRLAFNGAITPNRAIALGQLEIPVLKCIKDHFGVKLNDVVLTICALALRDHLIASNDLPAEPLVCMVPVSMVLKGQRSEGQGNQVGNMIVKLPVDIGDARASVAAVHASTQEAKRIFDASFENLFVGFAAAMPPVLSRLALQGFFSATAARALPPSFNLVVSNFPGPPMDLYLEGARLEASYPIGPVQSGSGLNITFMSCRDRLDYSVHTCRDTLPQAWDLADGIARHAAALAALCGAAPARPAGSRPARRSPARSLPQSEPQRTRSKRVGAGAKAVRRRRA